MERVDPLRPGERLPHPGSQSEVTVLTQSFNAMLDRLEAERRDSARRALSEREAERRRLAAELHDQLGQHLTAIVLQIDRLAETAPAGAAPRAGRSAPRRRGGHRGGPPPRAPAATGGARHAGPRPRAHEPRRAVRRAHGRAHRPVARARASTARRRRGARPVPGGPGEPDERDASCRRLDDRRPAGMRRAPRAPVGPRRRRRHPRLAARRTAASVRCASGRSASAAGSTSSRATAGAAPRSACSSRSGTT